ncbi:MAG: PAS domain S-box protein [Methylotenera sp.]|nr:MAG: PAS domain S-box protein [Methylotenera sp.]PPD53509.1 MAG: PAS domain S-box protein [Methylotenera sp.]
MSTKNNQVIEANIRISLTNPRTVLSVTEGIYELLGFKVDDFLAGHVTLESQIHAHDQDIADELFLAEINQSKSTTFNIRLRQANGRIRCVKGSYTKILDTTFNTVILDLLLQDAKSLWQHQVNQTMMANFKAMMDNTDDYIYFKDRNHVFTGASQALTEIADSVKHWTEFLGVTDYDVFLEEYADIYYSLEKQVFAGVNVAHDIQETRLQDGSNGWVNNRKFPIKNDNGEIVGLFGIARDITQSKLAELALQVSEESLRESQVIAKLGSYTLNFTNDSWQCSHLLDQIFGLDETYERSLASWFGLIHPDDRAMVENYLQSEALGSHHLFDKEYRIIRHADQTERWVHGLGKMDFDSQGRIVNVRGTIQDITDSRKEQLIEKSAILGNKIVGILILRNRHIIWANAAFENMLGFEAGELTGKPTRQFYINEEDYQAVGKTYANIEKEGIGHTQHQYIRKDGNLIWVDMGAVYLNKETNESLWTYIDITERKQAEDKLNVSDLALKAISQGVLISNAEGEILSANDAFTLITGFSQHEILGRKCDFVQGALTDLNTIKKMRHAQDNQIEFTGEILNYRKDGSTFWNELTVTPVRNEQNKLTHFIGITRDITERKSVETELRISATAFESQEGMFVTDAHHNILRVNQAFTIITGYSAEEAVGKSPRILKSGRHDAAFYEDMWKQLNKNGVWEGEVWNVRKNGEVYPENLMITAVMDLRGIVTNYVATLTDVTLRKAAEEEIRSLAFYDPLTGLPNRRLLLDRLNHALINSARSGKDGALLFLDLDHFKTLNDSLGHDVGDMLLRQVADRLTACVREGDTIARLGGDEYVIMLEDLSEQALDAGAQVEAVGEKILSALNQPYELLSHRCHSTPSIGITLFKDQLSSVEELLKQADIAMYQAKSDGRNTMRFFDKQMQDAINSRVSLEHELRKALDLQQFQLHYQIQVDISGRALGAEALIRWIHPIRGMVSPFHFIPVAEETGLILPIGKWVLETACAQLNAWQKDDLTRDLTLSINVSAKQFRQDQFVSQVKNTVAQYAINPNLLKIELTESMLLDNVDGTISTMNALKEIGIRFSLDDFGTGYSSLQYLKRLPLYQLKIDQSFVRDIAIDNSDQAIVRTIIAMAHTLNLNVIAEGVETEEQQGRLLNNGCTYYQGYLFGKPVPIAQFEASLIVTA